MAKSRARRQKHYRRTEEGNFYRSYEAIIALFDFHHNPKEGVSLLNPTTWAANKELAPAVDDEFMERIVDATAPVKACIVGAYIGAEI
jgi:predicted NAD-dependent protein-ADP-ribosyltransferase YbiA (DUF1768 family)